MDKLKNILKKDKKTSNLIFILLLLVIVLIFFNYIFSSDDKKRTVETLSKDVVGEESIDTKLSNIISKISGVNSASVLVCYTSTDKKIPIYDTKENVDILTDSGKTSTKKTTEKNVAYEGTTALIESKEIPEATGVIIVVNGNITENTKEEIKNAVSFVTNVPIHKIQIFVN